MTTPTEIKTGHASENNHWYGLDDAGNAIPVYEVARAKPGPNGETHRKTTLADAKKLRLLGSFSSIWKLRANAALDRWKQGNAIMAALTSPRRAEYEAGTLDEDAFLDSVLRDSEQEGRDAADTGTAIHAAIERYLLGEDFDNRWTAHVLNAADALATLAPLETWRAETVFARPDLGYGGKVDAENGQWVVDFKSVKPWTPGKSFQPYDSWPVQLAAYDVGLGGGYATAGEHRTASIVISRGDDAGVQVIVYSDAQRAAAEMEWHLTRRLWLHVSGMGEVLGVRQ